MQGAVQEALPYYRRALEVREALLESVAGSERTDAVAWAALALPVLTSLVKTADAEASVREEESAGARLEEARRLLARVQAVAAQLPGPLLAKLGPLEAYLGHAS